MLLVLLITGWAAGCPVQAETVVEVGPDPTSNLTGSWNEAGTVIQPLEMWSIPEYGMYFEFNQNRGSNAPAYYSNGSAIRLYSGNTFVLSTKGEETITKIEFVNTYTTATATSLVASSGVVTYNDTTKVYSWVNTDGVIGETFTVQNTQIRISSIKITFDGSIEVVTPLNAPVLSRTTGTFYEPFELTITDSNEPAATIRYTLDGTVPSADNGQTYTGPITIPAGNNVTVKAVAINENGISSVVTATYTYEAKYRLTIRNLNKKGVNYIYVNSNSDYKSIQEEGFIYASEGESIYLWAETFSGYSLTSVTMNGTALTGYDDNYEFAMPGENVELLVDSKFDPTSPSDPQPGSTEKKFRLTIVSNPAGSGYIYSKESEYTAGTQVGVEVSPNSGYRFVNWTKDGQSISTNSYFTYVMPAEDVVLTANFVFNPSNPGDPQQPTTKHPLTVVASPAGAGSFYISASEVVYGGEYTVQAYPKDGYEFKGWLVNGKALETTDTWFTGIMTEAGAHVVGLFKFNPSSPSNPGANYYNPETGKVIVDDFTPGNLYRTISTLTGGNLDNISSLTVKGRMNNYDYTGLNRLSNTATVDLSRVGGVSTVPNYSFENMMFSALELGAGIDAMGQGVFSGCSNLTSLTVHAPVPPTCSEATFSGFTNKDVCVLYVPAEYIELYSDADYWKDFVIMPIMNDAHVLQVNLPADASDGRYKHNTIEIVNINSGVRQKYVVSDRLLYTFNGMRKDEQYNVYMYSQAGLEIGRIENVTIPDADTEVSFSNLKMLYNVNAQVLDNDGNDVTSQVTVEWLKPLADGTVEYLRKDVSLGEVPDGQKLICRVTLDSKLGVRYSMPGDVEFTVSDSQNNCIVTLQPLRSVELTGTVVDGDNVPMANASVSAVQLLNGKFSKTLTARTGTNGVWTIPALDATQTRMVYSATECVNVTDTLGTFGEDVMTLDLGRKVLKSIVGARISYGFTYQEAGAETAEDTYADYQNVAISVFNVTQNRAHRDVSLQYPLLAVLDENISAGDELKLTATSKTGAFSPIERTVTVNDNQRAEVTFDIIGKGGIAASFEMTENPGVTAMLYGPNGELLKREAYSETTVLFTGLEDGEYTLVTMGQSDLMNSILRLSNFSEIGLTEGKDYIRNVATVETGRLTEIKNRNIPAFDESLFYYTNDRTAFSANKSSITTGNYLTLRSTIDFKGIYKNDVSNVALVVDLPEACDLVEQSVIQGPNQLPYTIDNKRLTVQLGNNYANQIRFCVIPTGGGEFNASASIVFGYNGKTLTQPIGTAVSEVKDIEIIVPSSTAKESFRVSGTARGHADVSVYVDGMLSAQTNANAAGNWTAECSLTDPANFSSHTVYAQFVTESGPMLESETRNIVYNPYDVHVQNVEMTFLNGWNHKQYSVIWDFEQGSVNVGKYDFYTTTDMTFLVRIAYHDVKLLPYVWLHVFTSDGKVRSLRADYNETKDCWVAMDSFSSNALPTRCSVSIENMMFDASADVSYEVLMDQYVGDIEQGETTENGDGSSSTEYVDKDGNPVASIDSYETDSSVEDEINKYKNLGYEEDETLDDDSDYVPEDEDDTLDENIKTLTKKDGSTVLICGGPGVTTRVAIIRIIREEGKQSKTDLISSTIVREWKSFMANYKVGCAEVTEYAHYTEYLDKYVTITTSMMVAHTVYINPRLIPPGTKIPAKKVLAKIRRIRHHSKRHTTSSMEYAVNLDGCKPKPPTPPTPPTPPVDPILDPSGYVYEAVPENRVEGVQASIYYKEDVEDMYGDLHENIVLWDAEEYAQKNPLFTDENGMYQWDVPQGLWQVKFEKDGYQTAYSEWLPVPPPQLDVNIGIVQNRQPEITEARAYEEGVEVQFDKYMKPSTLNTDNIYVTANGEKLAGTVSLLDSALADEFADEDDADATRYASRVRFIPETPLSVTTGEIRLTVSRNVLSYAGIPMTQTYSQVLDVEKEVQYITADDVKVLYGGEKQVTVFAQPFDAAVGRTLRIANSSDLIAAVDKTEAVLDEEGKAVITVKGELPGCAQLSFTIDDVTATGECAVDVVTELITAEAPVASRASGTAVYRGSKVQLTTDSKDAVIYFTTDGSCPCDAEGTRRKYTVPIVINDDNVKIIAMTAVGTGTAQEVSETVEFNYTLKKSTMDLNMADGWTWMSHNLESALPVATVAQDAGVSRIMTQEKESVRDPQYGMIGTLKELSAEQSFKVQSETSSAVRNLTDYAWNPASPIGVNAGWNWLGYPVDQTMSLDEAFATTDVDQGDVVVGQTGFAQYDGQNWIGTLQTMEPGKGYMYQSATAKDVVYNTTIVSNAAATTVAGIADRLPVALDIHKYASIMPVVATIRATDGSQLDNDDYQVLAFSGTECRGIGRVVAGNVMMNVYGNAGDAITFRVVDNETEECYANTAALQLHEDIVGSLADPYSISLSGNSGIGRADFDGNVRVYADGDMLRIKGIAPEDIRMVEMFDVTGTKVLHETKVSESGVRMPEMTPGAYVVIVDGNGVYTYHKISVR